MGIRDLIKKKDRLGDGQGDGTYETTVNSLAGPEFTFIRSDTHTQEIIYPPSTPGLGPGPGADSYLAAKESSSTPSRARRSLDVFKPRSRGNSTSSVNSNSGAKDREPGKRRLSHRLHLGKAPQTSEYVPENLPTINITGASAGEAGPLGAVDKDAYEREWESRATMLVNANEETRRRSREPSISPSPSPVATPTVELNGLELNGGRFMDSDENGGYRKGGARKSQGYGVGTATAQGVVSSQKTDADIQEAIRLHEDGELERSTALFGQLADPGGANNPLSQVLFGLALRHGWGTEPDPERAVTYLSAAASNAAAVETMALQAGLKKGGAAKGELVLAIFELANCFRHGWGIPKDPVAAKQYYETAANLGDTDAMNEVAWCYLEGFGCKKDKFASARYYRLAEENGNKTLGNTWIWKDKYSPDATGKKKK
ncbi:HCP-like protein [Xylariaceae sp. FL0016]|nr:HCP-like protein [Xylariaceae sp. FL0016]